MGWQDEASKGCNKIFSYFEPVPDGPRREQIHTDGDVVVTDNQASGPPQADVVDLTCDPSSITKGDVPTDHALFPEEDGGLIVIPDSQPTDIEIHDDSHDDDNDDVVVILGDKEVGEQGQQQEKENAPRKRAKFSSHSVMPGKQGVCECVLYIMDT